MSVRTLVTVVLLSLLCGGTVAASGPPEGEGIADRMCDTPRDLTGTVPLGTSAYSSFSTHLVWDGGAYATVFTDGSYVFLCRVAADGTPLLSPQICGGTGSAYNPRVVWTGTEYGVAWEDYRDGGGGEIYFSRVSATGGRLGTDVRVSNNGASSIYPSLAWSGSEFGIAWEDDRNGGYEIFFARISAGGVKQGADVRVTTLGSTGRSEYPSLVWNGASYAIAWEDYRDSKQRIFFNTVSATGVLGSEATLVWAVLPAWAASPSLTWNGLRYGLAWTDGRNGEEDIYFKQFIYPWDASPEVRISPLTGQWPVLVWTGAEYGVAWWRSGGVDFVRVGTDGVRLPGELRFPDTYIPALAYGTLGFGLVTTVSTIGGVHSAVFVGLGCHADTTPPLCPTNLTVTANSGAGVSLSWRPGIDVETELAYHRVYRDNALVAAVTGATYTDSPRPAGTPVYEVTAVNAEGRESYGCATAVAPSPAGGCGRAPLGESLVSQSPGSATGPSVAWTGREYGVAWQENRDGNNEIYFARMAADGAKIGSDVRVTVDSASSAAPSLVWSGSEFGLAWHDNRPGNYEIYFARIGASGIKQGADVRITTDVSTGYASMSPSLVWAGTEYGVVWNDSRDGNEEIYFARISASGVKVGSDVRITTDVSTGYTSFYPSLAWSGTEYGVAWSDYRDGNAEVYFARFSSTGSKLTGDVRITSAAGDSLYPSLTWAGTEYGVAWQDYRDSNREIYFARLSASGVLQGSNTRVTEASGESFYPALVWTGGEYGVAWRDDRDGNGELYYCALGGDGTPQEAVRHTWSSANDLYPALAVGGHGLGVVWYRDLAQDQVLFLGLGCGDEDATPPSCPGALAETARSATSVTFGWTPSLEPDADLGAYTVYKDGSAAGATTATTWTDTAFDPASGPVYSVVATNAEGLFSPGCATVDTADAVPPTCPENLLASGVTQTSARLDWLPAQDAKSGLKQYKVYRNDLFLANVAAGTTTYTDGTLSSNTPYNFAVRAEDYAGNYSATCTTASVYVSTAPITLYVTKNADRTNADLDWNDVNLNEYVVYRSTSPQSASELKRVAVDQTQDAVLQDGVGLWFYYIQQRE